MRRFALVRRSLFCERPFSSISVKRPLVERFAYIVAFLPLTRSRFDDERFAFFYFEPPGAGVLMARM